MMEQNASPTTDTEMQPPVKRLLRKMGIRRCRSFRTGSKKNHSQLPKRSTSTLSTATTESDFRSVCSADDLVFGCLKVRTLDDSLSKSFCSDDSERRSVKFSTIEVRSHPMIMGDNPSVSSGPPVTIDWEHQDVEQFDVSDYEKSKPIKRSKREIIIPAHLRESSLRDQGYARSEIAQVGKEVNRIKKCRNASMSQHLFSKALFGKAEKRGKYI
jgi:hypothetical protein